MKNPVLTVARQRFTFAEQLATAIPMVKSRTEKRKLGLMILKIAKRLHQASTNEV